MNWKKPKEKRRQPRSGNYSTWKSRISKECFEKCVYCAIPETRFGGFRNFHVDHFKPKSKFPKLINTITNLYYSCSICNAFKLDDWPRAASRHLNKPSYPDPGIVDYNSILQTHESNGTLTGRNVAANYIIERLYLNRPQLIIERRTFHTRKRIELVVKQAQKILGEINALPHSHMTTAFPVATRMSVLLTELLLLIARHDELRPYAPADISRRNGEDRT